MAKETFYFSHDYNTRSDAKIKNLLKKHKALGYGIYWMIVEDLYNNANALQTDYEVIAYDLRVDEDLIESVVNDFDLFVVNNGFFGSKSIEYRLNKRAEKSRKARESANKRWNKDANALPSQCEPNAIKERKVKETKSLYTEKEFIQRWTDAREHYLKKPYFKSKLEVLDKIKLDKISEIYTKNQIDNALKGMFTQKGILDHLLLQPTHFLELKNFEMYLTCSVTKEQVYDKKGFKKPIERI